MDATERITNIMNEIDNASITAEKFNCGAAEEELYSIIKTLAEEGDVRSGNPSDLKRALRITLYYIRVNDDFYETKRQDLINRIISAVEKDKSKEAKQIWIRMLSASLRGSEVRKLFEQISIRMVNTAVFPAIEAEAGEFPHKLLMPWYEEMLRFDLNYKHVCRILNRMAYFHLWDQTDSDYTEIAKAYFITMERRGVAPKNPYGGFFGESDHIELIAALLNDSYNKIEIFHMYDYTKGLVEKIADKGMTEPERYELETIMRKLQYNLLRNPDKNDLKAWDELLMIYGRAIQTCCIKASEGEEDYGKSAAFLAEMLMSEDNWLLRIIELEGADKGRLFWIKQLRKWVSLLEPVCGRDEYRVMNNLYGNLISCLAEDGIEKNREELKSLLFRQVASGDTAALMASALTDFAEDYYGKAYCTSNAMALIWMLHEDGEDEIVEKLLEEINETSEAVNNDHMLETTGRLRYLRIKYIVLLKKLGYHNYAATWEAGFPYLNDHDASIDRIELEYRNKDYDKALNGCYEALAAISEEKDKSIAFDLNQKINLLKYIANGELPEGFSVDEVTVADDGEKDRIYCRGTRKVSDNRSQGIVAFQYTAREWKEFHATLGTLAEAFASELSSGRNTVHNRNHYILEYSFDPEPVLSRGDFIKYLYKHDVDTDWFGNSVSDISLIREQAMKVSGQ